MLQQMISGEKILQINVNKNWVNEVKRMEYDTEITAGAQIIAEQLRKKYENVHDIKDF